MEVWVLVDPDRFLYNGEDFAKYLIFNYIKSSFLENREADFLI